MTEYRPVTIAVSGGSSASAHQAAMPQQSLVLPAAEYQMGQYGMQSLMQGPSSALPYGDAGHFPPPDLYPMAQSFGGGMGGPMKRKSFGQGPTPDQGGGYGMMKRSRLPAMDPTDVKALRTVLEAKIRPIAEKCAAENLDEMVPEVHGYLLSCIRGDFKGDPLRARALPCMHDITPPPGMP